uniref:Uncharacterized protein n=1 Tax=viral metagenome TaxID=1070528 RepID=A0A6C0JRZ8_9ZZZZ
MQVERPRDDEAELLVLDDQPCTYALVKTKDYVSPSSLEVYFTVPAREEVFTAELDKTYDSTNKSGLLEWLREFDFDEAGRMVGLGKAFGESWKDDESYHVFVATAEAVYDREREVQEAFIWYGSSGDEKDIQHDEGTAPYYGYTPGDLTVTIDNDGLTARSSDWSTVKSTTIFKPSHLKMESTMESEWLDVSKVRRLMLSSNVIVDGTVLVWEDYDLNAFKSLKKATFYGLEAFLAFSGQFNMNSVETVKIYLEDDEVLTGEAAIRLNEMAMLTGLKIAGGKGFALCDLETEYIKTEYSRLDLNPVSTTFPNVETLILQTARNDVYIGLFGTNQEMTVVGIVDLTRIEEFSCLSHVVCSRFSGHLGIHPMTDLNVKINKYSAKNARRAHVEP